jgi:hypothetical protein
MRVLCISAALALLPKLACGQSSRPAIPFSYIGAPNGVAGLGASGTVPPAQLPAATTSLLGAVKPDGSTCIISAGLLTCAGTAANVGVAPTAAAPHVSGDPTTGFYSAGVGLMDVAANGLQLVEFSNAGLNLTNQNTSILFNGSPFLHLGPTALYREGNYVGPRAGVTLIGTSGSGNGLYGAGPDSLRFLVNAYAETVAIGAYTGQFMSQGNANALVGEHVMGFDDGSFLSLLGQDVERDSMGTQKVEALGAQTVEDGINISSVVAIGFNTLHGSAGYLQFVGTFHTGDVYTISFATTNPQVLSGNGFSLNYTIKSSDTLSTIASSVAAQLPNINAYVAGYDPLGAIQVDSTFYGSLTAGDAVQLSCSVSCPSNGPGSISGTTTFYAIKPVYTNTNGTLTGVSNAINIASTQANATAVPPIPVYMTSSGSGTLQVVDTSNSTTSVSASTALIPNYIVNYFNGAYDLNPLSAENNTQLLGAASTVTPGLVQLHYPGAGTTDHVVTATGVGTLSGAGTNTALGWALTPSISCTGSCTGTVSIGPPFQGSQLVAIGDYIMPQYNMISPSQDVIIGTQAASYAAGSPIDEVCIGASACQSLSTNSHEIIIGFQAEDTDVSGSSNVLIGDRINGLTSGQNNVVLRTGTNGSNDTCITTGGSNIEIGRAVCVASPTASAQLDIGTTLFATGISTTGTVISSKVGIDYAAPDEILSIGAPTGGAHLDFKQTTAPTLACNGTGTAALAANSSDAAFSVTEGTATTACTLTFAGAYSVAPVCELIVANASTGSLTYVSAVGSITWANTSATADIVNGQCL